MTTRSRSRRRNGSDGLSADICGRDLGRRRFAGRDGCLWRADFCRAQRNPDRTAKEPTMKNTLQILFAVACFAAATALSALAQADEVNAPSHMLASVRMVNGGIGGS